MSGEFIVPTWRGGSEKGRKELRYKINTQKRRIVDQAHDHWFEISTNLEVNCVERMFKYTYEQVLHEQTTTEVLVEYQFFEEAYIPVFTAIQPKANFKGNYFVIAGCFLLRFENLDAALTSAYYLRERGPIGKLTKAYLDAGYEPAFIKTFVDGHKRPLVIEPDDEYNDIIGKKAVTQTVEYESPAAAQDTPLEEQLYQEFATLLDHSIAHRSEDEHQYFKCMGNTKIGTEVITSENARHIELRSKKRELTPRQWLEVGRNVVHPLCKLIPKPGTAVGDGEIRTVAAMTPSLEAFLRYFWNGVGSDKLDGYVSNLQEKPNKKYGYDIVKCDDRVGPYFRRYACERYPDVQEALFPRVIGRSGCVYRTQKLPSGVIHTSIVVNHFTRALMNVNKIVGHFNGDGILTDQEINHPWLAFAGHNHLNGFETDGQYVNEWKMLEKAWIRSPHKPRGKERYFLRYYTARAMRADVSYLPVPPYVEGVSLESDRTEVAQWAQKRGLVLGKEEKVDDRANVVKTHDEREIFSQKHLVYITGGKFCAFEFSLP